MAGQAGRSGAYRLVAHCVLCAVHAVLTGMQRGQSAGAIYKYDVSMPVERMYGLVEDMRARLAGAGAEACRVFLTLA